MKYYDILWTGNNTIDDKINSIYLQIKLLKIEIGFKKEIFKNKYDAPRSFWIIEKDKSKIDEILKFHSDVNEYFKEKIL